MKKTDVSRTGNLELRKRLPSGAIKALSEKYQFSWIWIHKIVTGKANGDPRIIADALKLAKMEDARKAALAQILNHDVVISD